MTINKTVLLFAIISLFMGCNSPVRTTSPTVTVSVAPQKFFVDNIAGDWLNVNVMIPEGASHATYEPTSQQMISLSKSQIYFRIGNSGFEDAWMSKIKSINNEIKVVDTSEDIELLTEEKSCNHEDSHSSHSHKAYNPHIWLSPKLVKIQAEHIANALTKTYPEYADSINANYKSFIAKCDSVDNSLRMHLEKHKNKSFIVYHPVWSYMAKDYELNQISIEHNGKEASAKYLADIIDLAKSNNIKVIFAQKEFSSSQAETIAKEIDGEVILMNPLAYDWFATMQEFKEAFK